MDIQLFLKQRSPLGSYPFQVFDGCVKKVSQDSNLPQRRSDAKELNQLENVVTKKE